MRVHPILLLSVLPALASAWDSSRCRANGGQTCGKVSSCAGTTRAGLCPGPSDIRCCFETVAETVTTTSSNSWFSRSTTERDNKRTSLGDKVSGYWNSATGAVSDWWNSDDDDKVEKKDSDKGILDHARESASSAWETTKRGWSSLFGDDDDDDDDDSSSSSRRTTTTTSSSSSGSSWSNGGGFNLGFNLGLRSSTRGTNGESYGSGDLKVTSLGGERWRVSLGDKSVSFSFCHAGGRTRSGSLWPHRDHALGPRCTRVEWGGNTHGGRVDLTTRDYEAVGVTRTWARVMRGIVNSESGGSASSLNTYDTEIVSWGYFQFAGRRGPLAGLLASMQRNPKTSAAFEHYFGRFGISSKYINVNHPGWGALVKIKKCDWRKNPGCVGASGGDYALAQPAQDAKVRKEKGWLYLRERPDLMGLFYLAGTDKTIAAAQIGSRASSFRRSLKKSRSGHKMIDYITSEYAVGRAAYDLNGNPQRAVDRFNKFRRRYPNAPWTRSQLDAYTSDMHAVPRFEAVAGDLSREPGSFRE